MVNINALGIIFPNTYDELISDIALKRTMASVPFAGRYRMIDFSLSAMVNAGIQNVTVLAKTNYSSLMDHLGSGREWDLSRRIGGLHIIPPFAKHVSQKIYDGRVEALCTISSFLQAQKEKYVILSDCHIAAQIDFADLIRYHVEQKADITMVYERAEIPQALKSENFTFELDDTKRIIKLYSNDYRSGVQNLSMNVTVINREELITFLKDAQIQNMMYFERDIIAPSLKLLHVQGYEYQGYRGRIYDMRSYFEENMRLLNHENMQQLFAPNKPVYTKVRDESPVRYGMDCKVNRCMIADGCVIEGSVENCVLFRGVKISKGAVVKNSVLMQGTVIEKNAKINYLVTDKDVVITENQELAGNEKFQVYVPKGTKI